MAVVPVIVGGASICGVNVGSCSVVYSNSSRQDLDQFHGIIWALYLAAWPQNLVLRRFSK